MEEIKNKVKQIVVLLRRGAEDQYANSLEDARGIKIA